MGQVCEICKKEFINLGVHVNKAHRISMDEYNKLYPKEGTINADDILKKDAVEETKLPDADGDFDTTAQDAVTPKEIRDGIFGEEESYSTRPLSVFLERYDISEKELRVIVRQYKTGSSVPVSQQIKQKEKIGLAGAAELKDKDDVETTNLHIAEVLTTQYGFECLTVRGKRGNTPKTWVLKKIK